MPNSLNGDSAPKRRVTVLCGGPSREHNVSLQSGRAIGDALAERGHGVRLEDVAPNRLGALDHPADVVFVALHGAFGEDGQIQAILEKRGIAYTGSGPAASSLAIHKADAKRRLLEAGLPTPRFDVVGPAAVTTAAQDWPLPVVVKPVSEGSSICCHIVRTRAALTPALNEVTAAYGEALVEAFVPGLEITVGILEDKPLPPIQIRSRSTFYDYHAKYEAADTEYAFEIDLPASLLAELGDMSLAAHRALGCRDFSRVDWRVDPGSRQPFILEVNTIPGFTSHSLLPMAVERIGLPMPRLCERIVELAVSRKQRQARAALETE
ncbi:MAG: D-alanine--D-alanine ligase [Phycisphaerae bacterium]